MKKIGFLFILNALVFFAGAQSYRLFLADLANGNYTEIDEERIINFRLKGNNEMLYGRIASVDRNGVYFKNHQDSIHFVHLDSIAQLVSLKSNPDKAASTLASVGKYTLGTITGFIGTVYVIGGVVLFAEGERSGMIMLAIGGALDVAAYALFQSASGKTISTKTEKVLELDGVNYQLIIKAE